MSAYAGGGGGGGGGGSVRSISRVVVAAVCGCFRHMRKPKMGEGEGPHMRGSAA